MTVAIRAGERAGRSRRPWVALAGALAATAAVGVPLLLVAQRGEQTVPSAGLQLLVDDETRPLDGASVAVGEGELIFADEADAVAYALYRGDERVLAGEASDGPPFALVALAGAGLVASDYDLLVTTVDDLGRSTQLAARFSVERAG